MTHSIRRFFYLPFLVSLLPIASLQAQSWQTPMALPTSADGSSIVNSLVSDGAGGYLLAGQFSGTITLGSFALTSAGGQDAFVARLNAAGVYTQALRAGGTGDDKAIKLVADATGLVTVAGTFSSPTILLGATTLTNLNTSSTPSTDIFVARLNSAGTWTQAAQAGSLMDDEVSGVALDPNGSVVVAGLYMGASAQFGTYSLTGKSASYNPYIARFNSNGAWTQATQFQNNSAPAYINDIAVSPNGTIVIVGNTMQGGIISFGNYTFDNRPFNLGNPLFVASLSRSGTWIQATQVNGTSGTTVARHLVLDDKGNAVLAGETTAPTASFGSYTVSSPTNAVGKHDFVSFVARLSNTGTWTQVAQTTNMLGNCYTSALALDAANNVWLTGDFSAPSASFGSITLTNSDPNSSQHNHFDLYIAKLNLNGDWTFATTATNASPATLVLSSGTVALAGSFTASATFGSTVLSSPAQQAGFLTKLAGGTLAARTSAIKPSSCKVWPNPASTNITLSVEADASTRVVQLFDALGNEVRKCTLPAYATSLNLAVAGLSSGCYIVRCGTNTGRVTVE